MNKKPPLDSSLGAFVDATLFGLGMLLIVTGSLKVHGLFVQWRLGLTDLGVVTEPVLYFLVGFFELFLGLRLTFFKRRLFPVTVALVLFAIFSLVQIVNVFNATESCGCLGVVQVSPVFILALDLVLLALLSFVIVFWPEKETAFFSIYGLPASLAAATLGAFAIFFLEQNIDWAGIRQNPLVVDKQFAEAQVISTSDGGNLKIRVLNRGHENYSLIGGEFT